MTASLTDLIGYARARRREEIAAKIAAASRRAAVAHGGDVLVAIAGVYSPNVIARASIKLRAIEILLDDWIEENAGELMEVKE